MSTQPYSQSKLEDSRKFGWQVKDSLSKIPNASIFKFDTTKPKVLYKVIPFMVYGDHNTVNSHVVVNSANTMQSVMNSIKSKLIKLKDMSDGDKITAYINGKNIETMNWGMFISNLNFGELGVSIEKAVPTVPTAPTAAPDSSAAAASAKGGAMSNSDLYNQLKIEQQKHQKYKIKYEYLKKRNNF